MAALRLFLMSFGIFGIYLAYHEAVARDEHCMSDMMAAMGVHAQTIMPCMDSLGLNPSTLRRDEKAICVMKCVMINAGVLAPNGSVDWEAAQKRVDYLPDPVKESAIDAIGDCGEVTIAHRDSNDDGNYDEDVTCEDYRDFVTCMTVGVAKKICNEND